jgi:heme A synthase
MVKMSFTPEFLEWVTLQMRANDTGLDAHSFAVEFFHRAFVGRGAEVAAAAPALLAACEAIQEAFEKGEIKFTKIRQADSDPYRPASVKLSAAIAAARGE